MSGDPFLEFLHQAQQQEASGVAAVLTAETEDDPAQAWKQTSTFPFNVYPDRLKEYVMAVSARVCVHPDVVAGAMLPVLASMVGASRTYKVHGEAGGWTERASLWVGLVGPPGSRKSPALKYVLAPVQDAEATNHEEFVRLHAAWQEAQRGRRAGHGDAEPEPVQMRLMVSDATIEAVGTLLNNAPDGLLVFRDELSGWVDGMGQYKVGQKSDDRQKWLELWSGSQLQIDRKGAPPIFVRHPLVNLLGGIQPDLVERIRGTRGDDGLADRFMFVQMPVVPVRFTNPPVPAPLEAWWQALAERMYAKRLTRRDLYPSPAAMALSERLFDEHYKEMEQVRTKAPWLAGFWSKADGLAGRVALVLACLRHAAGDQEDEEVGVGVLEDAWRVVEWAKRQHVAVLGATAPLEYERAGPSLEARCLRWLLGRPRDEQGRPWCYLSHMSRGPGQRAGVQDMFRVVDSLAAKELIIRERGSRSDSVKLTYVGPAPKGGYG